MSSVEGIVLYECLTRKVVRYGDKAVKVGRDIDPCEADTMRFIADRTSIPVPKIYDEIVGPEPGLTMEYIEGKTLDLVWKDLSREQKLEIAGQLRGYLAELYSLTGEYIGALNKGEAVDMRICDIRGGPFDNESQFNEFLLSNTGGRRVYREMAAHSLGTDHRIVFAHGEITPRNILVNNGRVVALLDWKFAGWYPEYWDYIKCITGAPKDIDFLDFWAEIFPKLYEREYIVYTFVGILSFHD